MKILKLGIPDFDLGFVRVTSSFLIGLLGLSTITSLFLSCLELTNFAQERPKILSMKILKRDIPDFDLILKFCKSVEF